MKSHNANHSEDLQTSSSRSSAPREGTGPTGSVKQPNSAMTTSAGSASSSSILPRMSDPGPASASNSASPQPMDRLSSAASKDGAGGTASPYGTRSRNRNGGARPNYAEDKDIDM